MVSLGLKFQDELDCYVTMAYGPGWKGSIDAHVWNRAASTFSLRVMDELSAAVMKANAIADLLTREPAVNFMRFGASRRLLTMWWCYRSIVVYIAPP
jgi:hypothetical protein